MTIPPPIQPPPPPSPVPLEYNSPRKDSWYQIERIAKAQKILLWVILLTIISVLPLFIPHDPATTPPMVSLAILIGLIVLIIAALAGRAYATILLSRALGDSTGAVVAWCLGTTIGGCIPLLGLIVLVVINQRATKRLQAAGLKVGLMGAKVPNGPPQV